MTFVIVEDPGKAGSDKACIVLSNLETVVVEVHGWIGPFIVHRRILHRREARTGWTVTHVATGRMVWTVAHFGEAQRVAQALTASGEVPAGREECLAWRERLGSDKVKYGQFVAKLSEIAPRFIAPEEM